VALASTSGSQLAFGLGAGYDFAGGGWRGGPHVALDYVKVDVDGFTETSGRSGLAVQFPDQTGKSLILRAGGRVSYAWSHKWGVIAPQARAEFIREFATDHRSICE
jgi:outer membrane lipase/esterase